MAAPVHDPLLLRRAASVVASLPGGPSASEARHRLTSGLPLAVGLPRADTEKLREQLLEIGLVPRIGPAPDGAQPLAPIPPARFRRALLALSGVAAVLGLGILRRASTPAASPSPAPVLAGSQPAPQARELEPPQSGRPEAVPAERRLELWAQLRSSASGLQLVGWVRRRGNEPPDGLLVLVGRVGDLEVLSESFEASSIGTQRRSGDEGAPLLIATVPFRLAVEPARLGNAEAIALEASWGEWRSSPLVVAIPGGG